MKKAPAETGAGEISRPTENLPGIPGVGSHEICAATALYFLDLLGKSELTARIRSFPPTQLKNLGSRSGSFDLYAAQQWQDGGRGLYLVINEGGDKAAEITHCCALFVEWDDQPVEWQLNAWKDLNLPEPSIQVSTSGKSIHTYWVLGDCSDLERWKKVQCQLIKHCGSDPICKDLSRVMRLPGSLYIGPDGKPKGRVEIVHSSDIKYTLDQFERCLPAPQEHRHIPRKVTNKHQPRPLVDIADGLHCIPRRVPGSNTYSKYRSILWGLSAACKDRGFPEEVAIELMEAHSPSNSSGWDVRQVCRSGGEQVSAGSFWFWAKHHGWRPHSHDF